MCLRPCIGMGFSPNSAGVSLRTFNRNFLGRSGTKDAKVYLVSPEVAAASAITGYITDPRTLGDYPEITMPEQFKINDNAILLPEPEETCDTVEVKRGPNIKPLPVTYPLEDTIKAQLTLKVGDDITTDTLCPQAPRYFLSDPIFRIFQNSASPSATKASPKERRRQAAR